MALINIMEKLVDDKLMEMLKGENCCKCEQCIEDMKAKALNAMPAKYVSSHNGELFSKLDAANRQNSVNLNVAVANAINFVAARPSHPPRPSSELAAELKDAAKNDDTEKAADAVEAMLAAGRSVVAEQMEASGFESTVFPEQNAKNEVSDLNIEAVEAAVKAAEEAVNEIGAVTE